MKRRRRTPEASEGAIASVAGGAVTCERLVEAAHHEGRGGSPLIRSLLAQSLPSTQDLAKVYGTGGGVPRIDPSFVRVSPKAARLIDSVVLRRHCCLPVEILEDVCVLAVTEARARAAVSAVRSALRRDVLPVIADEHALSTALRNLAAAPPGVRLGVVRSRGSPTQSRFRNLVVGGEVLDALRLPPDEEEAR
jgi:hypothetical protein